MFETTDRNLELFHKGLSKIWRMFDPDRPVYYPQLIRKRMSTKEALEDYLSAGDFPLPEVVDEGHPLPTVNREWAFPQRVRPFKVGFIWALSYEANDDDYYRQMSSSFMALRDAFDQAKEKIAADRWNNATSTDPAYANPDGLPLASENHRMQGQGVGQGTLSNLMYAPLNPTSVENMKAAMIMTKSHRGNVYSSPGPYDLIVSPARDAAADRIKGSPHQAGTDENDINVIGRSIVKVVSSPFFTNPLQWGLRQASDDKQPFAMLERTDDLVEVWRDRTRQIINHSISSRYIFFENGFRGLIVSTGGGK